MSQMNKTIAGRYVLKELIGQGGMADVYLAVDKILKRTVAVKIMRSSLTGDPVYVTRFHREASAAAALSHKNIVEIYDVGDEEDDYYIVMEYVPGQTLKELIRKRGALHYVEAVDIMKQVVSATAKAHSMGIIHRDLKPQNVMVTDSGVVKIGDFGIASIQSLSQVTQTDTIMGSLHYLAPEMARGEKATVQSDIYALGIVFYELLRGEVPFNGESPVNIALKHMRDDIPSVRTFNPSVPQSVENIIIKATAKNTQDRYQSANEMLNDLLTCLSREDEEKLVFDYHDDDSATIVAEEKDFFTQTQVNAIPVIEEEKAKKNFDKKKITIISACVAGAIALFLLIYFLFLRPASTMSLRDLSGYTKDEAIAYLENEGFVVDDLMKQQVSDNVEEGRVISTNPAAGTAVKKGDTIVLTISSGKYIVIDDYVGQNYETVKADLDTLGFTVTINEEVNEAEKGKIIKQSLSEGEKIDPTSTNKAITLTVSKGYTMTVPNVLGQDIDKAKSILTNADFKVVLKVRTAPTTVDEIKTMKINVVLSQDIEAFTVVNKKGQTITLEYYDHRPDLPTTDPTTPSTGPGTDGGTDNGNGTNSGTGGTIGTN